MRIVEEFDALDHPMRAAARAGDALRDRIHRDICEHGFDQRRTPSPRPTTPGPRRGRPADAAHGFLPAERPARAGDHPRRREEPLAGRLRPPLRAGAHEWTASPVTKGAFLACSFWLVDAYAYSGRFRDAEALFERLSRSATTSASSSEEYDPKPAGLIGNFPQAFSHLASIHSASVLADPRLYSRAGDDARIAAAAAQTVH